MTISTIAASPTIYSPVHSTESKLDYANFAALEVLEKELDRLKQERKARRLSMFSESITLTSSPSPPPQIKRRQSSSPDQFINQETPDLSSTNKQLSLSRRHKSCGVLRDQENQKKFHVEKENIIENKPKESLPSDDKVTPGDNTISSSSLISSTSSEEKSPKEINNDSKESQQSSVQQITDKVNNNNTNVKELTNSFMKKDEKGVTNNKKSKPLHREKKPALRIQTMFDRHQLVPEPDHTHNTINKETPAFLDARQKLKSTATPPQKQQPIVAPSVSKNVSTPYKLKQQSDTTTTTDKRASTFMQSSQSLQPSKSAQTTTNTTIRTKNNFIPLQEKRQEYKPKPLNDAFIGVKGLSQKFDSSMTTDEQQQQQSLAGSQKSKPKMAYREKPILSPASQSVSRERRISTGSNNIRPVNSVTALSQLFSSSSTTTTTTSTSTSTSKEAKSSASRPSKPLPPIHNFQQQQHHRHQQQLQDKDKLNNTSAAVMSLPSRSHGKKMVESQRVFHKTMPAVPNRNEKASIPEFPNPLPVYTPMLSHPVTEDEEKGEEGTELMEEKPQEQQQIQVPVTDTTNNVKKRVSFSSVVTSIPPPSPFSDEETEEETSKQRKLPLTMTSSHLLSLWQQQHEKERRATTVVPSAANSTATGTGVRNNVPSNNNSSMMPLPSPGTEKPVGHNKLNDTRGFWEAFNTEMSNRAAPDLRRVVQPPTETRRDSPNPCQQQQQQANRFIPSAFARRNNGSISPKGFPPSPPPISNAKLRQQQPQQPQQPQQQQQQKQPQQPQPQPQQQEPISPRKTWMHMLQDRRAKKGSIEKFEKSPTKALMTPSQNTSPTRTGRSLWNGTATNGHHFSSIQQNKPSTVSSRKPVISFDDHSSKNTTTPPLYHPTKTRPKKPSSFRKSHGHHYPMRNNIVGPEVSIPPVAVQREWSRNY
ncbi:hypothetical protein BDA99DRAFT_526188 [Phascolomyces articulosus]|uniref:Uncharacterized protein n=1 Tax=Phascolomyces articulosus TaxID=60185 RepID=A0AAD5JYR1_9FUNG|nr:hypothetical protein BDA99DRAFT_526188 [Phascolomyces articulosus]